MKPEITDIKGIGPSAAKILVEHGLATPAALANASVAEIVNVPGFSEVRAAAVKQAAADLLSGNVAAGPAKKTAAVKKQPVAVAETASKEKTKKDKKDKKDKSKGKKDKKKGKKKK